MATFDHGSTPVADSYARTLLELAKEVGRSNEVLEEFRGFVSCMAKDGDFGDFMSSPAVDPDARRDVLERHFRGRIGDLLLNALQVVNRKGRSALLPLIYERYRLALAEARNEVDVYVTSAIELSDALRKSIRDAVRNTAGKTARVREKVDPEILGGLVVQIGDEKLDRSVTRQLRRIHEVLNERASQEIHGGREYFVSTSS